MDYCPSQDWDRYCQSFPDIYCSACGADEQHFDDCECGEVRCTECHYCETCDRLRQFTVLPENYFWRTCYHCKGQMQWTEIEAFSDAFSGEPVPVHSKCRPAAQQHNQQQLEKAEGYLSDLPTE